MDYRAVAVAVVDRAGTAARDRAPACPCRVPPRPVRPRPGPPSLVPRPLPAVALVRGHDDTSVRRSSVSAIGHHCWFHRRNKDPRRNFLGYQNIATSALAVAMIVSSIFWTVQCSNSGQHSRFTSSSATVRLGACVAWPSVAAFTRCVCRIVLYYFSSVTRLPYACKVTFGMSVSAAVLLCRSPIRMYTITGAT